MTSEEIRDAIESFCDALETRAPEHVESFLYGRKREIKRTDLRQPPERFVSENLVWPMLRASDIEFITEPYLPGHGGQADFSTENTSRRLLGECKPFNRYEHAIRDLREYLAHRTTESVRGIATDGTNWVHVRDPGDARRNIEILNYHSFRPAMFDYWVRQGDIPEHLAGSRVLWHSSVGEYGEYTELRRTTPQDSAEQFESWFCRSALDASLESGSHDVTIDEFPRSKELNDAEHRTLDEFE